MFYYIYEIDKFIIYQLIIRIQFINSLCIYDCSINLFLNFVFVINVGQHLQNHFLKSMQNYVTLMKSWVQSGQSYISGDGKAKDSLVKIDKATTIYEARSFNDSQIDPSKCIKTLANLIYLFSQGQQFTKDQTDQLFFSITKLFQTEDPRLKRILYMTVKEMRNQPSIYIVTSSLLKDIHHKNHNFRRNALRTIPLVLDPSNLVQVQRYIKGLINDKESDVSSAALLSGIQMFSSNDEMVKKWANQISDKTQSKDPYVQLHSIILLSQIKKKDTNAFKKFLFSLMKQDISGIALVQLLRICKQLSKEMDYDSPEAKDYINFLNRHIRNRDDSVVLQVAKVACQSPLMGNKDLMQIVKILQTYLISPSTVKKYTVLKIYNNLLKNQTRKNLILNTKQIEKVLGSKNTSLSSIAASLLLRICSEDYLERLFQQIEKTMEEMSIDYKIDVIKSLSNVLKVYPKKYQLINKFLMTTMNRQKQQSIRAQAIKVLQSQIKQVGGQAKQQCIKQLTKFLSAAQYEKIHFQILGIISRQVNKQDINDQLLKNLITQIYLQEGSIRACGLSTLIKVANFQEKKNKQLQKTIMKFKDDTDQQVRSRIKFQTSNQKPIGQYELDLIESFLHYRCSQIQASPDPSILDLQNIHKWGQQVGSTLLKPKQQDDEKQKHEADEQLRYKEIFQNHSTFKQYGTLRKINKPKLITDSQAQIVVRVRVFLFDQSLVVQYRINNNMHNIKLQDVKVQLKHSGQSFKVQHIIPAKLIEEYGDCYIGLGRSQQCEDLFPQEKISSILKYTVKQYSGDKMISNYDDSCSLEDFEIKLSNYMTPWMLNEQQFTNKWTSLKGQQQQGTFQLKYASTQAAQQQLIKHFGMHVASTSDSTTKANMITISLSGKFLNVHESMLILMLAFDTKMGCLLKIKAKCGLQELADELMQSIQ